MSLADETLLLLLPTGVPLYSARGLVQTITPVAAAKPEPRYTVNGELRFIGASQFRKYETQITCTDQNAPAFMGAWPGMAVTVHSVAELAYPTSSLPSDLRTAVVGSTRTTTDGFTYYRPVLQCMVVDFDQAADEYRHDYQWRLTLRER